MTKVFSFLFSDKCGPPCKNQGSNVCGSNQKTYRSECHLKRESCLTKTHIRKQYDGQCRKYDFKFDTLRAMYFFQVFLSNFRNPNNIWVNECRILIFLSWSAILALLAFSNISKFSFYYNVLNGSRKTINQSKLHFHPIFQTNVALHARIKVPTFVDQIRKRIAVNAIWREKVVSPKLTSENNTMGSAVSMILSLIP